MYSLRIWFILFVAAIYLCSSITSKTTGYNSEEVEDEDLYPEICNENQTKYNCNYQRCDVGQESGNILCEGDWESCKCKYEYWLNSTNYCVLRKDCDVHPHRYDD